MAFGHHDTVHSLSLLVPVKHAAVINVCMNTLLITIKTIKRAV